MLKRTQPNGRTDIIKAMGNTKWLESAAPIVLPSEPIVPPTSG
jgi:hypothetical protein